MRNTSLAINCADNTLATTSESYHSGEGEILQTVSYQRAEWQFTEIIPGTAMAKMRDWACDAKAKRAPRADTPQTAEKTERGTSPKIASTATGFFISSDGHIVTNAHVVDGCKQLRTKEGPLAVIMVDNASDLALLKGATKRDGFGKLRSGRGPRPGEEVVAIGYPLTGLLSSDPIVTTGIISALAGIKNDRRFIQVTVPVQPGNSGGPLLGENSAVVGVVVGKLNAVAVAQATGDIPQNVNFAVSLGTLQSFLDANNVTYELDNRPEKQSPANIASAASNYTVPLQCWK